MLYDGDIREPLFIFLEEEYGKVRIIEEKRMGNSRADAIMVTQDGLFGIEIKSDADTYARLASQVKDYDLYFDCNYIVAGSSHAVHIAEHVPEWWGIITVDDEAGQPDFYILRRPKANPQVNPVKKLSILWRPELAQLQALNSMAAYKNKSKLFVIEKLVEKVPQEVLKPQVSDILFERDYNSIADVINEFKSERAGRPIRKTRRRRKYRKI